MLDLFGRAHCIPKVDQREPRSTYAEPRCDLSRSTLPKTSRASNCGCSGSRQVALVSREACRCYRATAGRRRAFPVAQRRQTESGRHLFRTSRAWPSLPSAERTPEVLTPGTARVPVRSLRRGGSGISTVAAGIRPVQLCKLPIKSAETKSDSKDRMGCWSFGMALAICNREEDEGIVDRACHGKAKNNAVRQGHFEEECVGEPFRGLLTLPVSADPTALQSGRSQQPFTCSRSFLYVGSQRRASEARIFPAQGDQHERSAALGVH